MNDRGPVSQSALSTMEILIFLKKVPLFSSFELEDLLGLKEITQTRSLKAGDFIFREGESGSHAYIIVAGSVEVVKADAAREKIIATLEKTAYFGEMAIIENEPRSAAVRAKTDCILLSIDGFEFRNLIKAHAELSFNIVKVFSRRIRDMMSRA
jgi:CRP/FNR family transcriptional regulator, cyclic AMP receptor protein